MFLEVGGFDESLPACEDYDLWLRICAVNPVLYLADKLVNKYGGHDDQLSRRYWGMDRFRIQAMEKMMHSGVLSPVDARATTEMLCKKNRNCVEWVRQTKAQRRYRLLSVQTGSLGTASH